MKKKEQTSDKKQGSTNDSFKWLNPLSEPLTVEKLREFQGMENLTDSQAQQVLQSIRLLAGIIVEYSAVMQSKGSQLFPEQQDNQFNQAA